MTTTTTNQTDKLSLEVGATYTGRDGKKRTITFISLPNGREVSYINGTKGQRAERVTAKTFRAWVSNA